MRKNIFYMLSFTWGLPVTLLGCVAAFVLKVSGHASKKWGYCRYFELGENWGGLNLGPVFFTNKEPSEHIRNHEFGHAVQNCVFGPFMLLIIAASVVRYWMREYQHRIKKVPYADLPPYDSIWFEGQATMLGTKHIKNCQEE